MRGLRTVLPAIAGGVTALALVSAAPAAGVRPAAIQSPSYPWVQPWTKVVAVPSVQPASIGVAAVPVFVPPLDYPWVQPWSATGGVPTVELR